MTVGEVSAPIACWDRRTDADIAVVGAGNAGLSFALRLPDSLRVVIPPKGQLGESNRWYAQGGIAASVGPDDDPTLHLQDTIAAGAGLVDIDAAMAVRGPQHPIECLRGVPEPFGGVWHNPYIQDCEGGWPLTPRLQPDARNP